MACPPLAGVACFSRPGVEVFFWSFHPPPAPPPKGDIKWLVPRWRGWPASAGRGWKYFFGLSILPLRPLRRGILNGLSPAGGGAPLHRGGGGSFLLSVLTCYFYFLSLNFSVFLNRNSTGANKMRATAKNGMPPSLCRELSKTRGST